MNSLASESAKRMALAKTEDGRYVFAVYGRAGFTCYHLFPRTPHYQGKIRKLAAFYGADVPARIDWDDVPSGEKIEKLDSEEEARIS